MAVKRLDPGAWLTLIAERAPGLRAAGVTALTLDGVRIQLAPFVPEPAPGQSATRQLAQVAPIDAYEDNATFGLPPDAPRPGFTRPQRDGAS